MLPDWFTGNLVLVQTVTGIVTAIIWLVYLQLLLSGVMRQRRCVLSINRGAGEGMEAHLLLTNLGYESIYVTDVLMTLHKSDGTTHDVNLTDREEFTREDLSDPLEGTLQGPLGHGEFKSLGRMNDILNRSHQRTGLAELEDIERAVFVVIGASQSIRGVRKTYRVITDDNSVRHLRPVKRESERLSGRNCRRIVRRFGPDA